MPSSNPGRQETGSPSRILGRGFTSVDPERQREVTGPLARFAAPNADAIPTLPRRPVASRPMAGWVATQPEGDSWYEGSSSRRGR